MMKAGTKRSISGIGMGRGTAPRWLGSLLLAAMVVGTTACEKKDEGLSEALEEVQDEVKDAGEGIRDKAREAKEEIADEVDDHT